ncbi:hypothetical protein Tco_1129323, partial [Tanacetum coccineum]
MNSVQTFLRKFNRYSFFETPKVLLLAWDRISEIKDAFGNKQCKPEDIQELLRKLHNDVQSIHEELSEYINSPSWNRPTIYFDDDDDEESSIPLGDIISELPPCIAITPVLSTKEPIDSLIMEDEHLDTIPAMESDELIKSSVEDLVHTLSESDGISESECDLPVCDDSSSKKDEVLDDIISIPPGNGNDHFNAESSLIESVLNRDNVISSPKIDFLLEEFAGELALIAPIPPGIVEADFDPKGDIRFIENLMYDNFFLRPPETLKDDFETVIDFDNDYSLSDDDSPCSKDIDYVNALPPDPELVSLEVVENVVQ